jgi:hypothetical protein
MKFYKLFSAGVLLIGLVSSNAFARDHFDSRSDRIRREPEKKVVSWTGTIRCAGETKLKAHEDCDMEFVREEDQEAVALESTPELVAAHCKRSTDLRVKIEGEVTPTFLFGGGELKVSSFQILNEVKREVTVTESKLSSETSTWRNREPRERI